MNTRILRGQALCLVAMGILALSGSAFAQSQNLRFGIVVSKESALGSFATTFAESVAGKTNGAVTIEIFDNGQLGGETDMLSSVRQGSLDLTLVGSPIIAQVDTNFAVTELPFLWKDTDTMFTTLNGPIGAELLAELDEHGLKGIAFGDSGPRSLLTRSDPVNGIDDIEGLKIRVVENPLYVASWRNFGANPVPMAWPEVYTGLQQGTIDAVDSTPWGTVDAKHYEVAGNIALTNHVYTAYVLVMAQTVWDALSSEIQEHFSAAALEAQAANRAAIAEGNESAIKVMTEAGLTVTNPERGQFRSMIQPVYDEFTGSIDPELLDQMVEANK